MPYASIADLPAQAKALPEAAQRVFLEAANAVHAVAPMDDTRAMTTAWAAVERAGWTKNDAGAWARAEKSDHADGVMLAFFLADAVAQKIALPGGEPADQLHCTLAYFGKQGDLPADFLAKAQPAVAAVAAEWAPIAGVLGGAGVFNASTSSDGLRVVYASPDCPGLVEFRQQALAAVESATGVRAKRSHGWTPHITLAYVDGTASLPEIPTQSITFAEVALAVGGEARAVPLSGARVEKRRPIVIAGDGAVLGRFEVRKREDAQMRVFGVAITAADATGAEVIDHGDEVISPEEMAETAFDYVANAGASGVYHKPEEPGFVDQAGHVIASWPFTPELRAAFGDPPGPSHWRVGIQITDRDVWRRVQSGELQEFSIRGTAFKQPVPEAAAA